jgi:hypothetical protein
MTPLFSQIRMQLKLVFMPQEPFLQGWTVFGRMERCVVFLYLMPSEAMLNILTGNKLRLYGSNSFVLSQQNQQNQVRRVVSGGRNTQMSPSTMLEGPTWADSTPNTRISFNPNGGSWSFVGKDVQSIAMDKATMSFGWVSGDSTEISNEGNGVILHEFGHNLGMLHGHPVTFARRQGYFERKWFVLLLLLFCLLPNSLWQPLSISIPQVKDGLSRKSRIKSSESTTLKKSATFPK